MDEVFHSIEVTDVSIVCCLFVSIVYVIIG